jgi:hypothetical protein
MNDWLVVGVFGLIYGLGSIGIARAFRGHEGWKMGLNFVVWILLIAGAVAIRYFNVDVGSVF